MHARIFLIVPVFGMSMIGCALAQSLHFADYTGTAAVEELRSMEGPWKGGVIAIRSIKGGPYPVRPLEWSKTVWHLGYYRGLGSGFYEGFNKLPVQDVDLFVGESAAEALQEAGFQGSKAIQESDMC